MGRVVVYGKDLKTEGWWTNNKQKGAYSTSSVDRLRDGCGAYVGSVRDLARNCDVEANSYWVANGRFIFVSPCQIRRRNRGLRTYSTMVCFPPYPDRDCSCTIAIVFEFLLYWTLRPHHTLPMRFASSSMLPYALYTGLWHEVGRMVEVDGWCEEIGNKKSSLITILLL